jgi:hypothetical protein
MKSIQPSIRAPKRVGASGQKIADDGATSIEAGARKRFAECFWLTSESTFLVPPDDRANGLCTCGIEERREAREVSSHQTGHSLFE